MLHTKYQSSKPYGFRQEDFFYVSPYISLCKACDPWGVAIFGPWSNLNKLGRGLPDDASYQISRLYALWFQTRSFFHVSPNKSLCKTCDPKAEPFLAPWL